jgi:hypothetical protein
LRYVASSLAADFSAIGASLYTTMATRVFPFSAITNPPAGSAFVVDISNNTVMNSISNVLGKSLECPEIVSRIIWCLTFLENIEVTLTEYPASCKDACAN